MATEESFEKVLRKAKFHVEEMAEILETGEQEDIKMAYEKVCEIYKTLETSITAITEAMLDDDKPLDEVRSWSKSKKDEANVVRNFRSTLKERLTEIDERETQKEHDRALHQQKVILEEQAKMNREQQKQSEEARARQQQQEEEWFTKRLELELELAKKKSEESATKPQSVKLQKYTITPFQGDFKDWLRFWNQFTVEVDSSTIPKISKFNYLLELVKGKPKEHILGLPHTEEGYEEAKKILESTYGKDFKVHKALIKELESLPTITSTHKVKEIHDFYNNLARTVRTLTTMKKIESAQSYVYSIIDKLGPVREALAQKDDLWEEWGLGELVENLRKYTDRNPLPPASYEESENHKRTIRDGFHDKRAKDKMFMAGSSNQSHRKPQTCVYCGLSNHRSVDCTKVLDIASRKEILQHNKLCYNCTGHGHMASKCRSRGCAKCHGRHHTSLCDSTKPGRLPSTTFSSEETSERFLGARDVNTTIHAAVVAKVNGVQARLMMDTGAGSSYICTDLITKASLKPNRVERRVIEQMYGTVDKKVEVYQVHVQSNAVEMFQMDLECINAEKPILTHLPNPHISELKKKNHRLKRLNFCDEDAKEEKLPVHIILGAADVQRIKTTEPPILGSNSDVDPGAEFTELGWVIAGKGTISSSQQSERNFLAKTSQEEFEEMCSLEVLGLCDQDQKKGLVHEDFKDQLQQLEDGTYSTRLPWKPDHPPLPTNKGLTTGRLQSTTRRLEKMQKLEEYHEIMKEQLEKGVLEPVPASPTGDIIHYIPHQPVIKEDAESTKLRIVYDCSAKQDVQLPSLNDCLETGPPLQPKLFDILLRNRMKQNCITGDIQKAFLQIKIDPEDRDALRLLWYNNLEEKEIVAYRFTRVVFGSGPSPYILGATLEKHISQYSEMFPQTVEDLLKDTYVDDVQSGGEDGEQLQRFKSEATQIMAEGGFKLHKWHSNIPELVKSNDTNDHTEVHDGTTYAKMVVGTRTSETKILGTVWNEEEDKLTINLTGCLERNENGSLTKRKMLSMVNRIFDLLGIAAPVVIVGKLLYSEVCLRNLKWDEEVPSDLCSQWEKWLRSIKEKPSINIPRSVVGSGVSRLVLHGFADASKLAVGAAIYACSFYTSKPSQQNLLVAKSRIAPKHLSIPRLELVAAHTLSKLMSHVRRTLHDGLIQEFHCWSDSTTVLYWIQGQGTWSQFVRNRTKAIKENECFQWHHVPTKENPSDLSSRGAAPIELGELWFHGPEWLKDPSRWPQQPEVSETVGNNQEKVTSKKEKNLQATDQNDPPDTISALLEKYSSYWRLLRVTAYMKRFCNNCRKNKQTGPLTTEEMKAAEKTWIILAQQSQEVNTDVDLKKDDEGIMRCVGRVAGYTPIYLPRSHKLVQLLIWHHHSEMLHGGVTTTMCSVRKRFWIPRLRSLVKGIVHRCDTCRRYRVKPIPATSKSTLPSYRTELTDPFAVTGVDFAGPIYHKITKTATGKAYIALFTCASIRAVHLKLCPDLSAKEFQRALKEFITRRGCPQTMVSDNAKTFVATGKWLSTLREDHDLASYMGTQRIEWRFNLSRAPWWGGFFERLIGMMKRSLSKVIGKKLLSFRELEEVLLDVEQTMNDRPLLYQGEEFEQPVLTPNVLLRGKITPVLNEDLQRIGEDKVTRRIAFIQRNKEHLRKRFISEYVHALEERQRKSLKGQGTVPKTGGIVLLKSDTKDKAKWRLGRVVRNVTGKDGIVRGLKLKLGNGYVVERPLQLVCDLEFGESPTWKPNPKAEPFVPKPRPTRRAKEAAKEFIKSVRLFEEEEL